MKRLLDIFRPTWPRIILAFLVPAMFWYGMVYETSPGWHGKPDIHYLAWRFTPVPLIFVFPEMWFHRAYQRIVTDNFFHNYLITLAASFPLNYALACGVNGLFRKILSGQKRKD
ncbi:MAG: hypothetical protein Q8Q08_03495 [Candidatus Omnitrophota bacterium]|nr:hypothetical protein [Candidatus Omnitrophota bacterium]MDZ4243214.1 hypothetical protein [Candidatus Omnitrophota bacterium]